MQRVGRLDQALDEARLATRRDPKFHLARIVETATVVDLGRVSEAREALSAARRVRPQLTLDEIAAFSGRAVARRISPLWTGWSLDGAWPGGAHVLAKGDRGRAMMRQAQLQSWPDG